MNRFMISLAVLTTTLLTGSAVYAQTASTSQNTNPLSAEVKGAYTNIKNNFLKAAEKMPEQHYGFKATPEVQTFAQRVAHIADANVRTCAATSLFDLFRLRAALSQQFEVAEGITQVRSGLHPGMPIRAHVTEWRMLRSEHDLPDS